jgi:hypothetical protein
MPKQRQRIVFCDCLDCLEAPARATDVPSALSPAGEAAVRQDPPPKSLVLLLTGALQPLPPRAAGRAAAAAPAQAGGEGAERQAEGSSGVAAAETAPRGAAPPVTSLEAARLPHLDRAARAGCLSFLTWRAGSTAAAAALEEPRGAADPAMNPAAEAEVAQILGVYEVR